MPIRTNTRGVIPGVFLSMTYKEVIIVTIIWYDDEEPFPTGDRLTTIIEELVNEGNYEIKLLRDLP